VACPRLRGRQEYQTPPEVDFLGGKLFGDYAEYLGTFKNTRNGRGPVAAGWMASTSTVCANIPFGRFVGPTPDGRKDGQPLADRCSPAQGTDRSGPTAAMNSVAKLPNIRSANKDQGTLDCVVDPTGIGTTPSCAAGVPVCHVNFCNRVEVLIDSRNST
jgi:pyruvate-formate lyase